MFNFRITGDVLAGGEIKEVGQVVSVPDHDPVAALNEFFNQHPDYQNDYTATRWDGETKGLKHTGFTSASNKDLILDVDFEE